jgi:hypothetical protein
VRLISFGERETCSVSDCEAWLHLEVSLPADTKPLYTAFRRAAAILGWRQTKVSRAVYCPDHAATWVVCAHCGAAPCACADGPHFEAVVR